MNSFSKLGKFISQHVACKVKDQNLIILSHSNSSCQGNKLLLLLSNLDNNSACFFYTQIVSGKKSLKSKKKLPTGKKTFRILDKTEIKTTSTEPFTMAAISCADEGREALL